MKRIWVAAAIAGVALTGCSSGSTSSPTTTSASVASSASASSTGQVSLAEACPQVAAIMKKEPNTPADLSAMAQRLEAINTTPEAEAMIAPIAAGLDSAAKVPLGPENNPQVGEYLKSAFAASKTLFESCKTAVTP